MAGVRLQVRLRDPDRTYGPREPVQGVVHVAVDGPVECRQLTLSWTLMITAERAKPVMHPGRRPMPVFSGTWEAGEHEYEFEKPAPRWPPSSEGTLIQWRWELTAVAELASGETVRASSPATMSPRPDDGLAVEHKNPGDPRRVGGNTKLVWVGSILAVLAAVLGTVGLGVDDARLIAIGFAGAVIAAGYALYQWVKLREIGAPQLIVEQELEPEPALRCALHFKPDVDVSEVEASLLVYERVQVSSADRKHEYKNTVLERSALLERDDSGPFVGRIPLPAPGAAPWTIQVRGFAVGWAIRTTVKTPGGGNYPLPEGILWAHPARGEAAEVGQTKTSP